MNKNSVRDWSFATHILIQGSDCYAVQYHLDSVACVLKSFGFHSKAMTYAAYLHDILEDTPITREQLGSLLGQEVSDLVWQVSDEPGPNRKTRQTLTYDKTVRFPMATALKLADRIANIEHTLYGLNIRFTGTKGHYVGYSENAKERNAKKARMYLDEYPFFRESLYRYWPMVEKVQEMWDHLDYLMKTLRDGLR